MTDRRSLQVSIADDKRSACSSDRSRQRSGERIDDAVLPSPETGFMTFIILTDCITSVAVSGELLFGMRYKSIRLPSASQNPLASAGSSAMVINRRPAAAFGYKIPSGYFDTCR